MEKVKVFIVEDEAITVAVLQQVLTQAGYEVCGTSNNAEKALISMDTCCADIVLLDINLTGSKDGVWLAEQINASSKIPFIYLTSFGDKRTIERAVRTRPYGYLIKPFEDADIFESINQALHNYGAGSNADATPAVDLADAVNVKDHMFIREKNLFQKVQFKNILYLQADKNYIDVVTAQKKYTIRTALKELIPTLPTSIFVQVNRSAVVNLHCIDSYGQDAIIIAEQSLSLTDSYRENFLVAMRTLG